MILWIKAIAHGVQFSIMTMVLMLQNAAGERKLVKQPGREMIILLLRRQRITVPAGRKPLAANTVIPKKGNRLLFLNIVLIKTKTQQ